ncbi:MAG: DUF2306 domain-containing protein [Novosphingobium sp.]
MSLSPTGSVAVGPARRALRGIVLAALALFVIRTAILALYSPWQVDDFPEALAVKVELLPWIFPVHMLAGGLVLLLIPATILLRRCPRWHRPLGRVTAVVVLTAGLTAFPVALVAPVTRVSAWGFAAQGAVWLVLLGIGLRNIYLKRLRAHRAAMLLMAATSTGAVFFRVYLALWAIFGDLRHYEMFYAIDAWIAWSFPLAACAIFLKRTGASPFDTR